MPYSKTNLVYLVRRVRATYDLETLTLPATYRRDMLTQQNEITFEVDMNSSTVQATVGVLDSDMVSGTKEALEHIARTMKSLGWATDIALDTALFEVKWEDLAGYLASQLDAMGRRRSPLNKPVV